jgi:hypothetical protein
MSLTDRMEAVTNQAQAADSPQSNTFSEAYGKPFVKAVEEHPIGATVSAVGAVALGAGLVYLSRGRALVGLLGGAGEDAASAATVRPDLLASIRGVSITGMAPPKLAESGAGAASDRSLFRSSRPADGTMLPPPVFDADEGIGGIAARLGKASVSGPRAEVTVFDGAGFDYKPVPVRGTAESVRYAGLEAATGRGAGMSLPPETHLPNLDRPLDPFAQYDQSGYRFIPSRVLAMGIRNGEGATLRGVDGPSKIVFGDDNGIQHIFYNNKSSSAEKADLMLQAGYAGLIKSDVLAAKAAGTVEGQAIGFTSRTVERLATQEEMQQTAIDGARAYVTMDAKGANRFTDYLTERFGPMTKDSQAWGRHIMSDSSSPESGWNPTLAPATNELVSSGLPISPLNRAVASNASVLKAEPWMRSAAIRGGAEYLEAKAKAELPEGASHLVKDTWYGKEAQKLPPEVVKTIGAVSLALGKDACADVATIEKVAALIGPQGKPEDAIAAYNALKEGEVVVKSIFKGK